MRRVRPAEARTAADRHWLERLLDRRTLRVAIFVVLLTLIVFRVGHLIAGASGRAWAYDFAAYWLAGRNVLAGAPIYSAAQLSAVHTPQEPGLYLYPPLLAVLVSPLSALIADPASAMWVWSGAGAILAAVAVGAVARAHGLRGARELALLVMATFVLAPVVFELIMGNVNMLLLALLSAAWLGVSRRTASGERAAGAAVAMAALIKVFPAVLVLWLALTGRRQAVGTFFVVAAVGVVATLPLVGLEPWLLYPRVLANIGPPAELWSSISPTAQLAEFVDFNLARLLVLVIGLVVLATSARTQQSPISFAVAVLVSMLVVPTFYPHYLALSVLPMLLACLFLRPPVLAVVSYLTVFIGGQLALGDLAEPGLRLAALLAGVVPLVALLLARHSGADQPGAATTVSGPRARVRRPCARLRCAPQRPWHLPHRSR